MVTALRLIQILVVLGTIPMVLLGATSMFSGGGTTPQANTIGRYILFVSILVPIPAVIIAEVVYRLMKHSRLPDIFWIPVVLVALPVVIWVWLFVRMRLALGG